MSGPPDNEKHTTCANRERERERENTQRAIPKKFRTADVAVHSFINNGFKERTIYTSRDLAHPCVSVLQPSITST